MPATSVSARPSTSSVGTLPSGLMTRNASPLVSLLANDTGRASNGAPISGAAAPKTVWVKGKPNPTTPFISVPGLLTGTCVDKNGFSYLEVHINAVSGGPRTETIEGDVVANGKISEDWGLHLIDANLMMGNLVDVVGTESKAYLAKVKK